jgi:hypothetical protein
MALVASDPSVGYETPPHHAVIARAPHRNSCRAASLRIDVHTPHRNCHGDTHRCGTGGVRVETWQPRSDRSGLAEHRGWVEHDRPLDPTTDQRARHRLIDDARNGNGHSNLSPRRTPPGPLHIRRRTADAWSMESQVHDCKEPPAPSTRPRRRPGGSLSLRAAVRLLPARNALASARDGPFAEMQPGVTANRP